jgi:hypothetical protein
MVVPQNRIMDWLFVSAEDDGGVLLGADGDGSDSLKSGSTDAVEGVPPAPRIDCCAVGVW